MCRSPILHLCCALLATPLFAVAHTASAADTTAAAEPAPLSDDELDEQRGGLRTPTGVEFGFGAVVDTYVDGKLALRSQLTWTPSGAVQTNSGPTTPDLGAAAAAAGIKLAAGASGTYIPGANGGTVVLSTLNPNQVVNTVLNTADNRDIRQNTTINLSLPDLQQYQAASRAAQMALKLQDGITSAIGGR